MGNSIEESSIRDLLWVSIIIWGEGELKKRHLSYVVPFIVLGLVLGLLETIPFVEANSEGWQVDVYTQKEPFNGAGLGQPSDAFSPGDLVDLYANVTYNGAPSPNILVSFTVSGPPNPVQNLTVSIPAAITDLQGVAEGSFRIPQWPSEKELEPTVLGVWTVDAYIQNSSDHLGFRVGTIIDIDALSIASNDATIGSPLVVQLSLVNIAMVSQNATLVLALHDVLANMIGSLVVQGTSVGVGRAEFNFTFQIPLWASAGFGGADASVLTQFGAPYCPSKGISFLITFPEDIDRNGKVDIIDVAMVSGAFGSYPGHPRWNPACDLNRDGRVDVADVAAVTSSFGKA
jgi:hypothetical protein